MKMKRTLRGFSLVMLCVIVAFSAVIPLAAFADDQLPVVEQETSDVDKPDAIVSESEGEPEVITTEELPATEKTAVTVEEAQEVSVEVESLVTSADNIATLALSSEKDIIGFSMLFGAFHGVINGTNITVTVPYDISVTNLPYEVIPSPFATVSPTSPQDFTNPVQFTVTAEDGSTKVYTVTVVVDSGSSWYDSDKDITLFKVAGASGTITGTNITVTVPYGTDVTALTPEVAHSGATISPNGAQDFSAPVKYIVTAKDGSTKEYTVSVTVAAPSSAKEITSYVLDGFEGSIDNYSSVIDIRMPYGTDRTSLTPVITFIGAATDVAGPYNYATGAVTHTVTAEDGTTKTYTARVIISTLVPVVKDFGTWNGSGTVTAKLDAPLAKFVSLSLNGKELAISKDFTAVEGGTVITLTEDYLKSLSNGDYTLLAEFSDGGATIPLRVNAPGPDTQTPPASSLPQTGDSSTALLLLCALFAGAGISLVTRGNADYMLLRQMVSHFRVWQGE